MKDEITFTVMAHPEDGKTYTKASSDLFERKYPIPILGKNGDKRLIINPDISKVIDVLIKIKENKGLCPSKSRHDPVRDDSLIPDNRCPCPDLIINGKCECGLFIETDLVPLIKKEDTIMGDTNERTVIIGRSYKHFKNIIVFVIATPINTETNERMVMYKCMKDGELYVRPMDMFLSEVDHDKYPDVKQEYRFELIEDYTEFIPDEYKEFINMMRGDKK